MRNIGQKEITNISRKKLQIFEYLFKFVQQSMYLLHMCVMAVTERPRCMGDTQLSTWFGGVYESLFEPGDTK